jgi:cysteinyl-tRNA synthetase
MIRIYDTQSRTKREFVPREPGKVFMYVCGPTVYNYIHVGNARTFINFDVIRRYFMWRGYDVTFCSNVTDVDDKIINKANEEGRTAEEVAAEYTQAFIEDMHAVGVMDPDVRPKATEEIPEMIELVQQLIDGGHAYEVEGDVYFSVRSFADYGKLSHRNIDEMESGHRELRAAGQGFEDRKRDPLDFAVWKAAKPGEPSWDSPWGQGRPGWHIECSAMSHKYLGLPLDIHGGGADLVFPHHENEIAQSESAWNTTFSNYWMHSGMLMIDHEKMSKSLGNFLLLRDVLKQMDPNALRMLMMQTHYRSSLDYSKDNLDAAVAALDRMRTFVGRMDWLTSHAQADAAPLTPQVEGFTIDGAIAAMHEDFTQAMDDDFNTAGGLGAVFSFIGDVNAALGNQTPSEADAPKVAAARDAVVELMDVFGIDVTPKSADDGLPSEVVGLAARLAGYAGSDVHEATDALIEARAAARKNKDWATADGIRDELGALGLAIEDTPQGSKITVKE